MSTLTIKLDSQNHWLADGTQTVWNFEFSDGYINKSHVRAYTESDDVVPVRTDVVIDPLTDFVGDFQLLISPAVPVNHTLVIYRATPRDAPLVDFQDGGGVTELNLDTTARQAVMLAQESADFLGVMTTGDLQDLAQDAITAVGQAQAAAANATASASNAVSAATSALTFMNNAAASAVSAASSALAAAAAAASAVSTFAATLSATAGSGLVGWIQSATGAIARTVRERFFDTVHTFDFMTAAQIADVKAGTFTLDCRAAVQAAINAAIAGGIKRVRAPGKGYRIDGVASADTKLNGLVIPFSAVNYNPADQIVFEGDGQGTVFRCGTANMVMFRVARNCTTVRDLTIDGNLLANTWGVGVVPESMAQTTTLVSQSFSSIVNVGRVNLAVGIMYQPGPQVLGADSGCFYHEVIGGTSNNNTAGIQSNPSSTPADVNRITRTKFVNQCLTRGNVGYYLLCGSEVDFIGCNEEQINSGTSPLATPTARYIAGQCSNINFYGGYSENCTQSVQLFANNVRSWGYTPASGSNVSWRQYAQAWADNTDDNVAFTPVVISSGGGAQGASTSTGRLSRQGKIVTFTMQVSAAKGSLAAGGISVTGFPFVADSSWQGASFQFVGVPHWSGVTLGAGYIGLQAYYSGAGFTIRKLHNAGAGVSPLLVADCADPIVFTVQGQVKVS